MSAERRHESLVEVLSSVPPSTGGLAEAAGEMQEASREAEQASEGIDSQALLIVAPQSAVVPELDALNDDYGY